MLLNRGSVSLCGLGREAYFDIVKLILELVGCLRISEYIKKGGKI